MRCILSRGNSYKSTLKVKLGPCQYSNLPSTGNAVQRKKFLGQLHNPFSDVGRQLIPVAKSPLTCVGDERSWIHHSERHQTLPKHVPTSTASFPPQCFNNSCYVCLGCGGFYSWYFENV